VTQSITSLIKQYAFPASSSTETEVEENRTAGSTDNRNEVELETSLVPLLERQVEVSHLLPSTRKWEEVSAQGRFGKDNTYLGPSHTRRVYISSKDSEAPRLVVKLDTLDIRNKKWLAVLPHADEIAYKIGKLFGWNTIPKTKTLHQYSYLPPDKAKKYYPLMEPFMQRWYPITFTFQAFVEGETLPSYGDKAKKSNPALQQVPYQKAFLLGMILGKSDARGDNVIFNSKTGDLFEIDNEYFGSKWGYPSEGVLNEYGDLKKLEIPEELLRDVLRVEESQLRRIQDKYNKRDEQLAAHWLEEPITYAYGDLRKCTDAAWEAMVGNLVFVKQAIQALQKQKVPVTLLAIEENIAKIKNEIRENELRLKAEQKERERIAREAEEARLKAAEWERRKNEPPKPSGNSLGDVVDWVKMGYCVVLHSNGYQGRVYYQGDAKSIASLKVICLDVDERTNLLSEDEWPTSLKVAGIPMASQDIQKQIFEHSVSPLECHSFAIRFRGAVFGKERC
jgi:hypothetical protein